MAGSVNKAIAAAWLIAGLWGGAALADNRTSVLAPAAPIEFRTPGMHIGDIVYLRSGSPPLTITEINEHEGYVVVTWFLGEQLQVGQLPNVALITDKPSIGEKNERKCQ